LIDSENLGPNHIVSIAAKRFLDRLSPFSKATVAAKQGCVDQFDQLDRDPWYDAVDAYKAGIQTSTWLGSATSSESID
jgi:hypothetical protein